MHENDIAREVVDAAFQMHSRLGPGLLESVLARPRPQESSSATSFNGPSQRKVANVASASTIAIS